jgi:hypothetical protein
MKKRKRPLHVAAKAALWTMLVSGIAAAALFLLETGDLRFVFNLPFFGMMAATLFFVAASALLIAVFRRIKRRYVRALIAAAAACSLCMALVLGWAQMSLAVHFRDHRIEVSPSGGHRLVIIESGFIDAHYEAHPMINRFMYKEQDNGFLSYHDYWGDITAPDVIWVSDTEAHVVLDVDFHPNKGSSDRIVVRF